MMQCCHHTFCCQYISALSDDTTPCKVCTKVQKTLRKKYTKVYCLQCIYKSPLKERNCSAMRCKHKAIYCISPLSRANLQCAQWAHCAFIRSRHFSEIVSLKLWLITHKFWCIDSKEGKRGVVKCWCQKTNAKRIKMYPRMYYKGGGLPQGEPWNWWSLKRNQGLGWKAMVSWEGGEELGWEAGRWY